MLETLHLLCQLFSRDSITVAEVAHVVGSGKITTAPDQPIVIEPRASDFQRIVISRIGSSDIPTHVTLTPARGKVLLIGQLRAVYGDFQILPRSNFLSAQRVLFAVKEQGMLHTSLIVAEIDTERVSDDSRVALLMVRRE
ncbi:MAG TPA: hypothetical protein VK003_17650 [Oceanobacillus sp.]|nr:hypothetical protein [Oceanobacillus sp.]